MARCTHEEGDGPIASEPRRGHVRVAEATAAEVGTENRTESGSRVRLRRKNFRLDQAKLDQVRKLLGAKSETDTIEQALDLVLFRREVAYGLGRIGGRGIARDIYARKP